MNYSDSTVSLDPASVALIRDSGGNRNGFSDDGNAWWIILLLLFGWGRNGFGGGFGGGSGVGENYVLATDFATIERKLDSISNGICDSTFALNNTMTNGFANVQNTLCQGFSGVNQAISTNGYETRLGVQGLSSQLASCCCDIVKQLSDCCCGINRGIDGINYNMAINTNSIQQTLCNNTRDIIDNQNANYRALHDEIVANRMEDKNAQIQAQQNEINSLRLAASQSAQNAYLINELAPKCPVPAFLTCNPYTGQTYTNGYGYGCGCNSCGC